MIPTTHLIGFAIAAYALIVIPGPSVLFAVGRSLSLGRRSGLVTVLGNTAGTVVPLVLTTAGLGALLAASTWALTVVKLVGAAYLIYLGIQAIRNRKSLITALDTAAPAAGAHRVFRQGFIVGMTNPKTALFFAAVLPQFADPAAGSVSVQIAVFGAIFVLIALVSDSVWALLASTARNWFARSPKRLEAVGATGGWMIVGLGAGVAVSSSS
ncbi:LysE family translocator [Mycobacteroides saopaulense]|uniref:Lysine transporter LysE n=1 Tax=Mycobacteroides saopaulense TaxID=1578165 RepID=A0A1S1JRB4_9MYCO|nr:LysE family translocator [Mycobacteroides saopaulense]ALR13010.1 lysine transporter LysE [Mycobacteroides saopaulense]OHT88662.1 lysine transporter LysE [Mycobacteroides saopaulense]OHU13481.1 lysine transporter LysE [Mycobacteroides saopaulense]ORB60411.1 lysine transporter LysE [Mycobacteroides saopaulense]